MRFSDSDTETEKNKKTFKDWGYSLKYIIALAILGCIITINIFLYYTNNLIMHADRRNSCSQVLFPFQEDAQMVFSSPVSNYTSLINENDFSQLKLYQNLPTINTGQPVWVSEQNQLWIPDVDNHKIYIYEILSWRHIHTIDTYLNNCSNPTWADYHPKAGSANQGQIWISCASSLNPGWAVYQPFTFNFITFIPMPLSLDTYLPYQIAVGEKYTLLALQNTTATTIYSFIQYDNDALVINIISSSYGTTCSISYNKMPDSALYVSSIYTNAVYKVNFTNLALFHTWSFTSPIDIVNDISHQYLFVLNSTNSVFAYSTSAPGYSLISGYPVSLPYSSGQKIQISNNNDFLYAAYNAQSIGSAQMINPVTFQLSSSPIQLNVANSSKFITNIAISCPCALCQ